MKEKLPFLTQRPTLWQTW